MRNYSTLIYFVNNFQNDVETTLNNEVENNIESFLTAMETEPSDRSVNAILDFARSYDVLETKETGYVELNLN